MKERPENGSDGFTASHLTSRAVQKLVKKHAQRIGLDPEVTVHSLRVTAVTTARERDADIIELQDFAGYGVDPIIGIMASQMVCNVEAVSACPFDFDDNFLKTARDLLDEQRHLWNDRRRESWQHQCEQES